MGNSNTEISKKQRAETARKAMQKRLANPDYKQISIGGDKAVIERFISLLEETGKATRIEQLKNLIERIK